MTRILLVSHYFAEHGGGIELIAGTLADRLARRGMTVEWAASAEPAARPSGTAVARLPMTAFNWTERKLGVPYPLWAPAGLLRLAGAVRRCDAVHLHDCLYAGNVAAFVLARLTGKPVLITQHVGLVPYRSWFLRGLMSVANRLLGRVVLGGADQVVYYSPVVRDYFGRRVRLRRPPAFVVNGVDTDRFRPLDPGSRAALRSRLGWPANCPVLLFVGRFVEKKGLPLLRELAAATPGCTWIFVGCGPLSPAAWALPNVRCLGKLPPAQVAACHQAADFLVLPSVGEGFPLVVQEAMACGTPAVITEQTADGYPPVRDLVYAAPPEPNALRRTLQTALADPGRSKRRAAVAAFAREHWDWGRCAERYEALIRGAIEK